MKKLIAIEYSVALAIVALCSLAVPILLFGQSGWLAQNSQFLIGPIVNCTLIYSALNFRGVFKTATIVLLPSVSAITLGLLSFSSIFAMYMIPAIWLGNTAIVLLFKYLHTKKNVNFVITSTIAVAIKAALIFGGYSLLVYLNFIPTKAANAMYLAMGFYQIITATAGCILAYGATTARSKTSIGK